jgi:hypothetical protein
MKSKGTANKNNAPLEHISIIMMENQRIFNEES